MMRSSKWKMKYLGFWHREILIWQILSRFVVSNFEQRVGGAVVDYVTVLGMYLQFRTFKIVYRRYAGLYFILCVDVTDNEMMYLESIHLFVEVCCPECLIFDRINWIASDNIDTCIAQILDHYFGNVCELDLVFGFHKVYCILDEFIVGGEMQETSKKVILERLRELNTLETWWDSLLPSVECMM